MLTFGGLKTFRKGSSGARLLANQAGEDGGLEACGIELRRASEQPRAPVTLSSSAQPEPKLPVRPSQRLIFALVVTALLGGWAAIFSQIRYETREAEEGARARAHIRAELLEQYLEKTRQLTSLATLFLSETPLLPGGGVAAPAVSPGKRVEQVGGAMASAAGVAVWDREGRPLLALGTARTLADPRALRSKPSVKWDVDQTISGPYAVEGMSDQVVLVRRRVERGGRLAGYVGIFLGTQQLLNFPGTTRFLERDLLSVVGLHGITFARREGNRFSSGQNLAGRLVMRQQQRNPNGSYLGPSSLDGHVRYFTHRRLAGSAVFVTAGVSRESALESVNDRAVIYISAMTALSVIGLLLGWLIYRKAVDRDSRAMELAESERRLREAQRVGKIGDWEYDLIGDMLHWSVALCAMYERAPRDDELSLDDLLAYVVPEDRPRLRSHLNQLKAEGGHTRFEVRVVLPSGRIANRCITAHADSNAEGRIVRLYGTDQDVTDTHLLRDLEAQLAHTDRQGAMSVMAGTLAHELNQPLTAASNYISAALRASVKSDAPPIKGVHAGMRHALEQINDAAEIMRGARKLVRVESDSQAAASVAEVVASTKTLLHASGFHAARQIRVQCEADMADANISRIQLQQVLLNLLKNALEAAPAENPHIVLEAASGDRGMLDITVTDNGPGFPSWPFDAFSFVTTKGSGMGVGLSISRTIIEHHGGKIWIERSVPGATTIAVRIPSVLASADREYAETD